MIRRTLRSALEQAAAQYPVVSLTGPRQSGKTTLVRAAFPDHDYRSLEDPDVREYALEDPRGFLGQFKGGAILDEVQRAPDLFSYIQTLADEEDAPGRFILSGSQNFLLLRSVSQSLAGRSAILHLLPFSLSELWARPPFPLRELGKTIPERRQGKAVGLLEVLHRGFYPRIHDKDLDAGTWYGNYYQTYVERDVREIINVGDLEAFGRFVRLCAGRNGQLLNLTSLGNDCGVTHATVRRWISILEAGFLVVLLRPHHANFGKRLIKSPKLYFLDTGLLCYLLRIRSPQDLHIHSSRGAIFESFVVSELLKNALHQGREPDLHFWRDSAGNEIDAVLERGTHQVAIEIKSGQTIAKDFFSGLDHWRGLVGDPDAPAALVYGGDRSFQRRGFQVYSWSVL
ncbi:MAG TPA: ATP-binding protein [Acidobacteriota bacterium]|nr:ATP-binding protein [Acidobacteriota bacterium]